MPVTISDEMLAAAHLNETEMKRELAVALFEQKRLTLEQASRFAEMQQLAFQALVAERKGFPCHKKDLPAWSGSVLQSLAERWGVEKGWDGYQGQPTNPALAAELLNCLGIAIPSEARAPIITPLSDGGVQAEWHKGGMALEIVVPSGEPARFYFYDPAEEQEACDFAESIALISKYIGRF